MTRKKYQETLDEKNYKNNEDENNGSFELIFPFLKKGMPIRRDHHRFHDNRYIKMLSPDHNNIIGLFDKSNKMISTYHIDNDDVFANNWEVIQIEN